MSTKLVTPVYNDFHSFSNNLWIFPEPVFCRMKDSQLTAEEVDQVKEFQEHLGTY